jgi:tRNA pseudouridine55 synthase
MNGLLIVDKPAGITSHDVVARVRRILKTKRVGHTGTLDPFATGVMVILIGQATRLAQFLDKDEKEYEAIIGFGFETDTGDRTGVTRDECRVPGEKVAALITPVDWNEVFALYLGEIEQLPPMFSAKKVKGTKLYEHARRGDVIDRKPINVTVSRLEKIGSEISSLRSEININVVCSAGTYIRTLAEDIGRKIGTFAHLAELRRKRSGKFTIDQSLTLDELEDLDEPASALISMNEAVSHLPVTILPDERIERTKTGLSTRVAESNFTDGEVVRIQTADGDLIAIGFYNEAEKSIQPRVVLV